MGLMKKIVSLLIISIMLFLTACSNENTNEKDVSNVSNTDETSEKQIMNEQTEGQKILIAYFTLWGNSDFDSNVDVNSSASVVVDGSEHIGTTEYMAKIIQKYIGGDLHLIQTVDKYPDDFDAVVDRNHKEMEENYMPELVSSDLDIEQYDTVFIGYPVWATTVPRAIYSFLEEYNLEGKTVIPFCTYDGYGSGDSYSTIADLAHQSETTEGLAIESKDVQMADDVVKEWLDAMGISQDNISDNSGISNRNGEKTIKITIGDVVLDGVIYDTELAQEIQEKFPLTVSMSGFGGREYYGGIDFEPENVKGGQLHFENGDITYCKTNNTMAIFYAQTDNPDLTMEVIPIGKVTSDLKVFDTLGSSEDIIFSLA